MLGLPLCLAAARVGGGSLLAPPARRQFSHWHLPPLRRVSSKRVSALLSCPFPFGYRQQALLEDFLSMPQHPVRVVPVQDGRKAERKPRDPMPPVPKSQVSLAILQNLPKFATLCPGFLFIFLIVKGNKEEGGHSILDGTGNFHFNCPLPNPFRRKQSS